MKAELRDLRLEGPGYGVDVPAAEVVLAPRALTGALAFRSIEIEAPVLRLSPGGETPQEEGTLALAPIEIEALAIRGATVHWTSPEDGELVVEGITVSGAVGEGALVIDAPLAVWRGEQPIEIGPSHVRLVVASDLDVDLDSLESHLGTSRLTAHGSLARGGRPALELDWTAKLDLDRTAPALGYAELSGALDVTGWLEGPADRLSVTLDAHGRARWQAWPVDELRLHLEGRPDAGRAVARLGGSLLGGTLEAEAQLDGDATTGRLRVGGLDSARFPSEMQPPFRAQAAEVELTWDGPLAGPLQVDLAMRGRGRHAAAAGRLDARARGSVDPRGRAADLTWTAALRGETSAAEAVELGLEARGRVQGAWPPELTGELTGTLNAADGLPEDEMTLACSFRAHGADLSARLGATGPFDLTLDGQVQGERLQAFSLIAERIDLTRLGPETSGRASLHLEASGPLRDPEVSAQLTVDALEWGGVPLGRLDVGAGGTQARAELRAALPDLSMGVDGEVWASEEGPRVRGQGELRETSLARLGSLAGVAEPPEGHVTASLGFEAPLGRWAEAEATLDVSGLEASHRGQLLRTQPFRAELRQGRLAVQNVRVEGRGLSLDLDASAGLEEDAPVELRAWIEADMGVLPLPEGWSLAGNLSGAVGLAGTLARPALEGALHAGAVTVKGPDVPDVEVDDVEVHLGDRGLLLPSFQARVGEAGRATLEGEIPYASVWPALRGGDLAPSEWARLSAAWESVAVGPFDGGLDGELTLTGGLASLGELTGELRLPARRLAFEGMTLEVQPATLRLEAGRVTTEGVTMRSAPGDLVVTGGADLLQESLDVRGRGEFDLGLLSSLLGEGSIGGSAAVDLAVSGPLAAPVPRGSVALEGVSVRVRALPQAVTGVRGRVEVEGDTAVLEGIGDLGGGTLHLEGEARAAGASLGDLWLQLTGRGMALRYPPGLRSRLDVDLTLAGRPGDLVLAGNVGAQGGIFDLDTAVREALRARTPAATATSDLLRDVALDVTVDLARPIAVQSSFGSLEANGRVTARGDLQEPAPFGRLDVRPGGRIQLQGRDLTVTGGTLAYTGSLNGDLSLSGETVVPGVEFNDGSRRDLRVRASVQGSMDQPSLVFTSDPPLSRQEIVSAIATGRLQSSLVDSSAWLLGGQAATLVSGQLTGVAQTFGLDEITVRPDLIARETDPSARFTFGKRIGQPLALVYSAGLGGPETRYAEVRGYPGLNVQLRALRRDSGSYELGFGQRFEFGGLPPDEPVASAGGRLQEVRFEGAPLEEDLRSSVRLSTGKRVPDWRVQQEAERLRTRLRRRGHLDAQVSARIDGAAAVLTVEPGPIYGWRVEGMLDPPSLDQTLEKALFEADAVDLGRARLLRVLGERGHLRAEVEATTTDAGARREILFAVEPGPRFDPVTVRFPGARALSPSALLVAAGGARRLLVRPETAVAGLQDAYRASHFFAARIAEPRVDRHGAGLALTVAIDEGPPANLLWIRAEGATLPEAELREAWSFPTGAAFSAATVTGVVARTRAVYLSRGYPDVRIRPETVVEGSDVGLRLRIREGERRVIQSVTLSGNTRTRDWLVERALDLEEGEPLDPRRLAEAERRLLGLGTFSRSAIVPHPEDPGRLEVHLQEAARVTATYDLRWDDEIGWSGLVDGLAGNLLGLGVGLGGRVRYGEQLREFRGSLHLPAALAAGDVTGSVFRTEEDIPADDFEIVRRQTGFQLQHSIGQVSRLRMLLGYRFRRNLTIAPTLPDIPIDIGGVDVSFLRTTQDDLLDPRRGAFWSLNLNLAPSWLGSDAPLVTSYLQTVFNRSFQEDAFTWAQSYRLGLAWGLDGEPVIANERFRAGGASSLRGFGTNEVGPRGFFGEPAGGEAVVIMNQELRYHHRSGLGLVGFYDVGNVFPTVESMRFDLRHTLGTGLRWASPIGLLRVDVGFPLDRQPEEKSYHLFFGVGQAF